MLENLKSLYRALMDGTSSAHAVAVDLAALDLPDAARGNFVVAGPEVMFRLRHMAALYGLSIEDLREDPHVLETQIETCSNCNLRRHCEHKMFSGKLHDLEDAQFCPNAGSYGQMMFEIGE